MRSRLRRPIRPGHEYTNTLYNSKFPGTPPKRPGKNPGHEYTNTLYTSKFLGTPPKRPAPQTATIHFTNLNSRERRRSTLTPKRPRLHEYVLQF